MLNRRFNNHFQSRPLWSCPLAALSLLLAVAAPAGAQVQANAKPEAQKMAVPSYFYPGRSGPKWEPPGRQ